MSAKQVTGFLVIVVLTVLAMPLQAAEGETSSWYDSNWQYRKKITFNSDLIGSDLGKFPALVRLDDSGIYDQAKEDGSDLRFTSSDGVTRIPHELESANDVWVRLSTLYADQDTTIYVYYGNSAADDDQDSGSVWNNGYTAVYHLNSDPDAQYNRNSVGDRLHLDRTVGAIHDNAPGQIDQAVQFPGKNAWLQAWYTLSDFITPETGTMSAFFKADVTQPQLQPRIVMSWDSDVQIRLDQSNTVYFQNRNAGGTHDTITAPYTSEQWHHAVWRHGDGQLAAYLDGASVGSIASSETQTMHERGIAPGWLFAGEIDEIRLANVARSGDWIKAEYISQCQCEDFVTVSSEAEMNPVASSQTAAETTGAATTASGGSPQAVNSPLESINQLFRLVHQREITFAEWSYWAGRVAAGEKQTLPVLLGAMQYQALVE